MAGSKPLRVAVLDASGTLAAPVEAELSKRRRDDIARFIVEPSGEGSIEDRERALKEAVLAGRLDGYLQLPADAIEIAHACYFGKNVSNMIDLRTMQDAVSERWSDSASKEPAWIR